MLRAISGSTLLDDVFLEDPTTNGLQEFIAGLTGHEASLLVTSGTQGNQVAIRSHLDCAPPYSVLCDARSHIYGWEAGGAAWISGALARPVQPSNGKYLTLDDVKLHTIVTDDVHAAPTKLICVENTLAGMLMPLDEIQKIREWARAQAIPLHCDGARLWEAVAADVATRLDATDWSDDRLSRELTERLRSYAACFDSISFCFSKGLGAPIGSVLTGSRSLIKRARHIRKAMGAGMRQAGILAAPARVAVEETFLGGRLAASHVRAKEVARIWEDAGGKLQDGKPVETNMVWCDLASIGTNVEGFVRVCKDEGLRTMGGRLVVHYQIGADAVERWRRVCGRLGGAGGQLANGETDEYGEGPETGRMKLNVE